jgi:hypothetical protein
MDQQTGRPASVNRVSVEGDDDARDRPFRRLYWVS